MVFPVLPVLLAVLNVLRLPTFGCGIFKGSVDDCLAIAIIGCASAVATVSIDIGDPSLKGLKSANLLFTCEQLTDKNNLLKQIY